MKKIIINKVNSFWIYLLSLCYLEVVLSILVNNSIWSINIINILIYNVFCSVLMKIISSILKDKYNLKIFLFLMFLICFVYIVELLIYQIFGFYFDFSLLGATDQALDFAGDALIFMKENIVGIILLFIPFILCIKCRDYIGTQKYRLGFLILVPLLLVSFILSLGSLYINKNEINSAYELYYEKQNIELSVKKLGVINTLVIDLKRNIFGFEEKITIIETEEERVEVEEIIFDYNNLTIDFEYLINNTNDDTIKQMHQYFQNEKGTLQNEYTGYFKDKNLILFMAESFNEIAIDEVRTPTLYKLVNSGFVFKDFYTPTISSTIGGEFQELTGLVAASGFINPWKKGENSFPFGIARSFANSNFTTYAYHNNSYSFQSRNKYLSALGFNNFLGCFNGLENRINCKQWPESDVEMIEATFGDYINDEHFFVYYVTVSGHGEYSWGNAMSKKHKEKVIDLGYSEKTKAYLSAQIELDQALELLITKLEESGKLDDTVIALVGDHYPYYLSLDEINEVSSYKKDEVVEINHSNFILWNNNMENVLIDKIGSQIDVLPTIYNIFGIEYDSRLIIGKDILSSEPGLAIFGNSSWVSDYGTYFANSNTFVPKEGKIVPDDYVQNMNIIVNNKINMSKLIMSQDYYKYIN